MFKTSTFYSTLISKFHDDALANNQFGTKIQAEGSNPPNTPQSGVTENVVGPKKAFIDYLTTGITVAISNPMIFVPTIIGGILTLIISVLTTGIYFLSWMTLLEIISTVISFILGFASLDLARDAYEKKGLDLGSSVSYVIKRFGSFFVAAILGTLLSLTVVLIPVVILMFVIMVVDEAGIIDSLGKAVKILFANLVDIIVILVVTIVGSFLLGLIPFLSTFLVDALYVVIGLACIDLYSTFKHQ
jgi:hypothetical protein